LDRPYYEIVREERQFCAALMHLLWSDPQNVSKFIGLVRDAYKPQDTSLPAEISKPQDVQVFIEFAYLRDRWHTEKKAERPKWLAGLIKNAQLEAVQDMILQTAEEQGSPTRWDLPKLLPQLLTGWPSMTTSDFRRFCKFKWAFNAKPDLVVLPRNEEWCVAVEGKLESGESSYLVPSVPENLPGAPSPDRVVGQVELQRFTLTTLLGLKATHVVISKKGGTFRARSIGGIPALAWSDVLDKLAPQEAGPARQLLKAQVLATGKKAKYDPT